MGEMWWNVLTHNAQRNIKFLSFQFLISKLLLYYEIDEEVYKYHEILGWKKVKTCTT